MERAPASPKEQFRETHRLLEERAADLMQQSALLQQDIDSFKNELAADGISDHLPGGVHVCACALCPAVWSKLPNNVLDHIFTFLPFAATIRLRVLSKTWNSMLTGVTPGFTKACAERQPDMFALVSVEREYGGRRERVVVKPFLHKEGKWHNFVPKVAVLEDRDSTCVSGDGGLVCFVSTDQYMWRFPMKIVVINPLTSQSRVLPLLTARPIVEPRMVQLVMDENLKSYKVLVVGKTMAKVYSSETGKWINADTQADIIFPYLIFGYQYKWNRTLRNKSITARQAGPSAYHCRSDTFLECDYDRNSSPFSPDHNVNNCVLVKDHLFVISLFYYDTFFLEDYQVEDWPPRLVLKKVHECPELDDFSEGQGSDALHIHLYGAHDFLVAVACSEPDSYDDPMHSITLLFDLSTNEWQIIPKIPNWDASTPGDMFQLRWDAVP